MFELRRLEKTVKKYEYFFQYEPEFFKQNIDLYIEDLTNLIDYTDMFISVLDEDLNLLYKANINLFFAGTIIIFYPIKSLLLKMLELLIYSKSNKIIIVKRYNRYFKNFLERLEQVKYFCDL